MPEPSAVVGWLVVGGAVAVILGAVLASYRIARRRGRTMPHHKENDAPRVPRGPSTSK